MKKPVPLDRQAIAHLRQRQPADALALAECAIRVTPRNWHAWYALGMAYYTIGESDKLAATIAHLDRFDPKMALRLTQESSA